MIRKKKSSNVPFYIIGGISFLLVIIYLFKAFTTKINTVASADYDLGADSVLSAARHNPNILKAELKPDHWLYLTVLNDGHNKDGIAQSYIRLAQRTRAAGITSVRVISADGKTLGEAFLQRSIRR